MPSKCFYDARCVCMVGKGIFRISSYSDDLLFFSNSPKWIPSQLLFENSPRSVTGAGCCLLGSPLLPERAWGWLWLKLGQPRAIPPLGKGGPPNWLTEEASTLTFWLSPPHHPCIWKHHWKVSVRLGLLFSFERNWDLSTILVSTSLWLLDINAK